MALLDEIAVDAGMDRGTNLSQFHLSKPEHLPFSSSEWEVAVFDPVVGPVFVMFAPLHVNHAIILQASGIR